MIHIPTIYVCFIHNPPASEREWKTETIFIFRLFFYFIFCNFLIKIENEFEKKKEKWNWREKSTRHHYIHSGTLCIWWMENCVVEIVYLWEPAWLCMALAYRRWKVKWKWNKFSKWKIFVKRRSSWCILDGMKSFVEQTKEWYTYFRFRLNIFATTTLCAVYAMKVSYHRQVIASAR